MKTTNIILLLVSIFILNACTFGIEPFENESKDLIGNWINPLNVDTLICRFERAKALQDTAYGFSIQSNKVFIERKNSGWCGTPPIAYCNYDGTWNEKDSIINITVGYWGGTVDYQWKLISVDDKYLTVYKIKEVTHQK